MQFAHAMFVWHIIINKEQTVGKQGKLIRFKYIQKVFIFGMQAEVHYTQMYTTVILCFNILHACATVSWVATHCLSNFSGQLQCLGNWFHNAVFSRCNSASGRAGMSCHPLGVHWFRILSPKSAFCANFTARIQFLLSVCNSGYFCSTSGSHLSTALSISSAATSWYLGFTGPMGLGIPVPVAWA